MSGSVSVQYLVKTSNGNCLGVESSVIANYTPLQLYPCQGTQAQVFKYWIDGKLYSALGDGTFCVQGDSTSASIYLFSPCTDNWDRLVGAFGNGEGMCMTAVDGSIVSLEPCNGGSEQIWSVDSIPTQSPIFLPSNAIPTGVSFPTRVAPTSPTPAPDPPILGNIIGYLGAAFTIVPVLVGIADLMIKCKTIHGGETQDHADKSRKFWIGLVVGFIVGVIFLGVGFGGTA